LKRRVHRVGHALEQAVDALKHRLKERSGGFGPLEVLAYRGHGNRGELMLRGRILVDRGLPSARAEDSVLQNLVAAYRRFETDEVPAARLVVHARGREERAVTDEEGFFQVRLVGGEPGVASDGWEAGEVVVPDQPERGLPVTRGSALFRVPGERARLGVISDVDDTILRTGATSLLDVARHTLLHNARTRLPFAGVAALYRALEAGFVGSEQNPVFYVSSSPWNLYDLFVEFIDLQDLPAGPIFLQDIGLDASTVGVASHMGHKVARIEEILSMHPQLPFVLLGDSGQKDPEVYREVVRRHPGRILAVYIRDVALDARDRVVVEVADRMRADGVDMLLVADSLEAAEHAADRGLIARDRIDLVAAEVGRTRKS
jgi:phosphatidate phosphatase APP1